MRVCAAVQSGCGRRFRRWGNGGNPGTLLAVLRLSSVALMVTKAVLHPEVPWQAGCTNSAPPLPLPAAPPAAGPSAEFPISVLSCTHTGAQTNAVQLQAAKGSIKTFNHPSGPTTTHATCL